MTEHILDTINKVFEACKHTQFKKEQTTISPSDMVHIQEYFDCEDVEALLLSVVFGLSDGNTVTLAAIIEYVQLSFLTFLPFHHHLEILIAKSIIQKSPRTFHNREGYQIDPFLFRYLSKNQPIPLERLQLKEQASNFYAYLQCITHLIDDRKSDIHTDFDFIATANESITEFEHIPLVSFMQNSLKVRDIICLTKCIQDALSAYDNNYNTNLSMLVSSCTYDYQTNHTYLNTFISGESKLVQLHLIELNKSNFGNRHKLKLGKKMLSLLKDLEEITIQDTPSESSDLIQPQSLRKIPLFYNQEEKKHLQQLQQFIEEKSYQATLQQLELSNLPKGITVLLYGPSGTGKTATVYDLASTYNRTIFKVDIAETKSMWYGESQKLIKKVFVDYKTCKEKEKLCPILLFNEADAILNQRLDTRHSTTQDTQNAIQNILLEELENFEGILMATTNLTNNLDAAFERRFLYKVHLQLPSAETAFHIWKDKLPMLSEKDIHQLTQNYTFSGGEIENVVRKCQIDHILHQSKISLDQVMSFCATERIKTSTKKPIGF